MNAVDLGSHQSNAKTFKDRRNLKPIYNLNVVHTIVIIFHLQVNIRHTCSGKFHTALTATFHLYVVILKYTTYVPSHIIYIVIVIICTHHTLSLTHSHRVWGSDRGKI